MESKVCLWLSSLLCFQGAGAHKEMCCTVPELTCLCRADLALRSHWHTEGSWANTTALLPGLQGAQGQQQSRGRLLLTGSTLKQILYEECKNKARCLPLTQILNLF